MAKEETITSDGPSRVNASSPICIAETLNLNRGIVFEE